MRKGGLVLEPLKRKDFSHEKLFGAADRTEPIIPLDRDISGVPVVYQGDKPFCVAATITWIRQWQATDKPDLAHEYLAEIAKIGDRGASPSQVLEPARKKGIVDQKFYDKHSTDSFGPSFDAVAEKFKVAGYTRVTDLSMAGIYSALKKSPLAIGVKNWKGVGPHFMAAYDVTPDGLALKCVNWWNENSVLIEEVPFKDVVVAYSFLDPNFVPPTHNIRAGLVASAGSFIKFYKELIAVVTVLVGSIGGLSLSQPSYSGYIAEDGSRWEVSAKTGEIRPAKDVKSGEDMLFGAGYIPVTGYKSNLTVRAAAADTSFTVASTNDSAGNPISLSNISPSSTVRIYLTVEPGKTRQEVVACTAISTTQFSSCTRGLNFQGDSIASSSTLAQIHPAGSEIIISNVGVFHRELVSIDGYQEVYGDKLFTIIPHTVTGTLPTYGAQFATKAYADGITGAFSSSNVSSTNGLVVYAGSPVPFGINLPNTLRNSCSYAGGGLYFDPSNSCALSINLDPASQLMFSGGLLTIGSTFTSSTVSDSYLVNMQRLNEFVATGTAGMVIAEGKALYVSTTGTLFYADSNAVTTTYPFVGFSQSAANTGQTVIYVRPGGIIRGVTGLTIGTTYFLSTNGTIAQNSGNVRALVGKAISASSILLEKPDFATTYTSSSFALINGASRPFTPEGDSNAPRWIPNRVSIYPDSSTLAAGGIAATGTAIWTVNPITGASSTIYTSCPGGLRVATSSQGFILHKISNVGCGAVTNYALVAEYDFGGQYLQ